MRIPLTELEQAINHWRARSPAAGEELRLCPEAAALAEPYALAILARQREIEVDLLSGAARRAFDAWLATRPA